MMRQSAKGKILVLIVFLTGIASGVLLDNIYETRWHVNAADRRSETGHNNGPMERSRRDFDAMAQYLGLDDSQRRQVRAILDEMRVDYQQLQRQADPQFRAITEKSRQRIDAVLNPEQRRKMEQFRHDHEGRGQRSAKQ